MSALGRVEAALAGYLPTLNEDVLEEAVLNETGRMVDSIRKALQY